MIAIIPISQPGSAVAISTDRVYIAGNKTIIVYNSKSGKTIALFPDLERQILFLGILEASGMLIAATSTSVHCWQLGFEDYFDVTAGRDLMPKKDREITIESPTCMAVTNERIIIASNKKLFSFAPDEREDHSIILSEKRPITALCAALAGVVLGDRTGGVVFSPSASLVDKKHEKIVILGGPIKALVANATTVFVSTESLITAVDLVTKTRVASYELGFIPATLFYSRTLIAFAPKHIFLPIESKPLELPLDPEQLGDFESMANCGPLLVLTGKRSSLFITSPKEAPAPAAAAAMRWWFW